MNILGFYPPDNDNVLYKLRSYGMFIVLLVPVAVFGVLGFLLTKDMKIMDYNAFLVIGMPIYTVKFLPFVINGNKIKKCINYFDSKLFQTISDEKLKIEECVRVCRRITAVFLSGLMLGGLSVLIKPFLFGKGYQLPLDVWLPFNTEDEFTMYVFVYCLISAGLTYVTVACAVVDSLIWGLACHGATQLQILKYNLEHLDHEATEEVIEFCNKIGEATKSIAIYQKIKLCARHYDAILSFVSQYEKCFSQAVFSELSGSIVLIGVGCLQMSKVSLLSIDSLTMAFYLCALFFQIFCFCYYGTTLYEEHNTLGNSIYTGKWYNYNTKAKKALILLMERSKRPMIVTVGILLDLTLDTFTMIIRRSYSLLALLKNFD